MNLRCSVAACMPVRPNVASATPARSVSKGTDALSPFSKKISLAYTLHSRLRKKIPFGKKGPPPPPRFRGSAADAGLASKPGCAQGGG